MHPREYLREFSEGTTLHGLKYIGEPRRHWTERGCWVAALIFCTGICGYEMSRVWLRWNDSPIILSFAQHIWTVKEIPFPAVTICPGLQIPKENFDLSTVTFTREVTQKGALVNLMHLKENLSAKERLKAEASTMACGAFDMENVTIALNDTHLDTYKRMVPSFDYFVQKCHIHFSVEDCSRQFRPIYYKSSGMCYTYNMNVPKLASDELQVDMTVEAGVEYDRNVHLKYGGIHHGLDLVLRVPYEQIQDNCWQEQNVAYQTEFKVYLGSQHELPYSHHIRILPSTSTEIKLQPVITSADPALRKYEPKVRKCTFDGDVKMKFFKKYSRNNCWAECDYVAYADRKCCRLLNVAPKPGIKPLPHCWVKDHKTLCEKERNFTAGWWDACDYCLPPCEDIEYQITMDRYTLEKYMVKGGAAPRSNKRLQDIHFNNHTNENDIVRYEYARISVYFENEEYMGIHRNEVFGFTDVLSNFGGLLGLFTGFSMVTVIEILYYATLRLCCNWRQKGLPTSSTSEEIIETQDCNVDEKSDQKISTEHDFVNRREIVSLE